MIKRIALASVLALMSITAANALTREQAWSEMASHYIGSDGQTGIKNTNGTVTVDVLVSPAESGDPAYTGDIAGDHCPLMPTMNGGFQRRTNVNADCTPMSLNPGNLGSRPAVYDTEDKAVCNTSTKVITWNGPNTDRAGEYTVTSSNSTRDGSC